MPDSVNKRPASRYLRILKRFLLISFLLVILMAIAASVYTFTHKDEIRQRFVDGINEYLEIQVDVGKIDISLLRRFPYASIRFRDVSTITPGRSPGDPELLKAESITFLFHLDVFFKKDFRMRKIEASNAFLNLIIFKDGKNNFDILKDSKPGESPGLIFSLDEFRLKNVRITYNDKAEDILATLTARNASLPGSFTAAKYDFVLEGDLFVESILIEGQAYLDQSECESELPMKYDTGNESLTINDGKLKINNIDLDLGGKIELGNSNIASSLTFSIAGVRLEDLLNLVPESGKSLANQYIKGGLIDLQGDISFLGSEEKSYNLKIQFGLEKGVLADTSFPLALENCRARGSYLQETSGNIIINDLKINEFNGTLGNGMVEGKLRFLSDTGTTLAANLKARLELSDFEKEFSSSGVHNTEGSIDLNILINRHFGQGDKISLQAFLEQGLWVEARPDAGLDYAGIEWRKIKGIIKTDGTNGEIDLEGTASGDRFAFTGKVDNLIPVLMADGYVMDIKGKLTSDHIPLDKFLFAPADKNMDESPSGIGNIDLDVELKKVSSRYISGENVKGRIVAEQDQYIFQDLKFESLKGNATLNGVVEKVSGNRYHALIRAKLAHIDISELFRKYENFGQEELTYKNIGGFVGGTVEMDMDLDTSFYPVLPTISSRLRLKVNQGKVMNYEPFMDLARFIKTGDLSRVEIEPVENEIIIRNQTVIIPEMEVKTNAINVTLSGTHRFDNVIDYHFKVLLSDVLGREARRVKTENEEFGYVEDDGLGKTSLFLHLTGTVDNPVFRYDKQGVQKKIATDLQKEKTNIKEILKDEFRWLKQDSLKNTEKRKEKKKLKSQEEGKFILEWDENEDQ